MSGWESLAEGVYVVNGDTLDIAPGLRPESVDAIVTDPPYGIGFMGKEWDTPGAFVERKAAKRNTFDHVAGNHNPSNPQDAARTRGVEAVRFQEFSFAWASALYDALKPGGHLLAFGGTRTYHRMACAIEDAGFEVRDCLMWLYGTGFPKSLDVSKAIDKAAGAERAVAREWQGWGTALKPACEPIILARKTLSERTVAANVLEHGTGALNIDASRISTSGEQIKAGLSDPANRVGTVGGAHTYSRLSKEEMNARQLAALQRANEMGRWPANVLMDEDASELLGEPSRFFYVAKPAKRERNAGVEKNAHPTVKPVELMRYLVRMVTPPCGLVLDPFLGSGTTGIAAVEEGFRFAGIEREAEYFAIAKARIAHVLGERAA